MFIGTYNNSIDAKNRMIVPAKFREQLGGSCIITRGFDRCLYIYSPENWEKQVEKMEELPEADSKVRSFIRHMCANASECEFDKQGRIIIPPNLIEYAEITKELVTMGALKKVEIWAKEVWDAPDNSDRMDTAEFAETLKEYKF